MTKRIDQMYAFVVVDPEDDQEGIPTWSPAPGLLTPMVGADPDRVVSLRKMAQAASTDLQRPVTLVRYSQREDLEVIEPGEPTEPTAVEAEASLKPDEGPQLEQAVAGWVDAPSPILMEADVDVYVGGVHVFAALIDGKPTVCFQFLRGDEDQDHPAMKPIGLTAPHSAQVGPLAIAAHMSATRALRQQQN